MNTSRFLQHLLLIKKICLMVCYMLCFIRTLRELVFLCTCTHDFKSLKKKNIIMNVNYGHYTIFIFIYRSCRGVLIDMCE